ncbi:MAG TPA: homocysteine S-methyltransferase family protein, partial [Candidatus Acidoferrales bacterium]|nr:homocysteine S-methyltransferase family protein [Candidatus Acidoferrales bacterium]
MTTAAERHQALKDILEQRVLVLDGAMGTMIHAAPLSVETDYLGRENCPEILNVTRPDVIQDIHRQYLEAGADIIETNTFGGAPIALADNKLDDRAYELNFAAARLAREIADRYSTASKPRFVAGSMGPTNKDLNITGTATFDQLRDGYYVQSRGLVEGGADFLLIETCFDTGSLKAGLLAVEQLRRDLGIDIPAVASVTIERTGTMLGGQGIDALYASIAGHDLLAVGMNCATGPDLMTDHIRTLAEMSAHRISCYPNAGLPNAEGKFGETPESLAAQLERFAGHGWLNLVGGCCGTTPAHIRAIAQMIEGRRPRQAPASRHRAYYSGVELVEAEDSNRPLLVGERTNVIGSRLFKNLVAEEKWEEATDIARRQFRNGAHVIDVCLQSTDRDEINDIPPFYEKLVRKIKAPVMIDTTDPKA